MKMGIKKIVIAFLLVVSVFRLTGVQAAETNISESVDSIVTIRVSYQDGNGKQYLVREGTGFLIGESAENQTVVTCRDLVIVEKKELDSIIKKNNIDAEQELIQILEVIATKDITVRAAVQIDSADLNCAILSLDASLYDRDCLSLGDETGVHNGQNVYALEIKEGTKDVGVYTGTVISSDIDVNKVDGIEHSAMIKSAFYGSPVLNQSGDVIGINVGLSDSGNVCAISVAALKEVLDAMGIPYVMADTLYAPLEEKIESAKGYFQDSSVYTSDSLGQLERVCQEAKGILGTPDATDEEYQYAIDMIADAEAQLVTWQIKFMPYIIAVGVALGIVLILDLIIFLKNREKKEPEVQYLTKETTVQRTDYDKTVELGAKKALPKAFLLWKRREQKIEINRVVFQIGREPGQVDFVIAENKSIGRHHADIVCENGFFFVIDRGSVNHTAVNGEVLVANKKRALHNKDMIQFANEEFIFKIEG